VIGDLVGVAAGAGAIWTVWLLLRRYGPAMDRGRFGRYEFHLVGGLMAAAGFIAAIVAQQLSGSPISASMKTRHCGTTDLLECSPA
jgi:hypothetical protein